MSFGIPNGGISHIVWVDDNAAGTALVDEKLTNSKIRQFGGDFLSSLLDSPIRANEE